MAAVIARMAKSATNRLPARRCIRIFVFCKKVGRLPVPLFRSVKRSPLDVHPVNGGGSAVPNRILVAARDRPLVDDFELYRSCADSVLESGTDCPAC
jgi:hypothetical protein